jgi:bleomycin hydrolase
MLSGCISRALTFLFTSLVGDGGQWALFVNLVKKYGVCPREAFPETYSSDNSIPMLKLLRWKLKEGAKDIRNAYKAGDSQSQQRQHGIRKACLAEIYKILTLHLGTPPKRFDFSYIAKGTAAPTKMTGSL